jgi:uncharacterized membrane protein YeaQ/YmgE (transglycosylase-associated protein family)
MKVIFGILFAVIIGLIGARFAGWFVDQLIATQRFVSPDQVAQFDIIARVAVTLVIALIGAAVGVWVSTKFRRHFFQREP